ncbi:MAG: nuclear transport factor 2 family protein [Saprospiraceae bacterium]|nr:nuclear transport factor 2 family protein [Saprospiraceae bacterium]
MHYSTEMLVKRQQIVDVVSQLFIQTDNRNWLMVEKCFADDVEFDMTSLTGGEPETLTPQEITARWEDGFSDLKAIHHQVGNFVVDLHGGDFAHVFCYGIAYHFKPVESGRNTRAFVGSYEFDLERGEDDLWRISSFWFDCKFVDGNADLT